MKKEEKKESRESLKGTRNKSITKSEGKKRRNEDLAVKSERELGETREGEARSSRGVKCLTSNVAESKAR